MSAVGQCHISTMANNVVSDIGVVARTKLLEPPWALSRQPRAGRIGGCWAGSARQVLDEVQERLYSF